MNQLKVKLWGKEIGHLVWNSETRTANFIYNSEAQDIPDIAPIVAPKSRRNLDIPIFGDERPLYQGLPPFIADSLPDSWGNTLMDIWFKDNKIPRNKITPLHKLAFIGKRGMGALELEPITEEDFTNSTLYAIPLLTYNTLDLICLYDLSLSISEGKDSSAFSVQEQQTLKDLITIGTSAGGRQPKIIVAHDPTSNKTLPGYLNSDDVSSNQGLDYLLIKFNSPSVPLAEIEYAYHLMAVMAGIEMEFCALWKRNGVKFFITRRFDRKYKEGKKILTQTLAAINPEATSYEDIVSTCHVLNLSEKEIAKLYRRLVFNVLANNTDDHNKNISFLLEEGGQWHLAPAYDLTYIFNETGTGPNLLHRMSVRGKRSGITKADLLDFAKENGIPNAEAIIDEVALSLSQFNTYANTSGIPQPWKGIIQNTIKSNLTTFVYNFGKDNDNIDNMDEGTTKSFTDSFGRKIENVMVTVNSKGHYELSAFIDGHRKRRFIRPNMPQYSQLNGQDIYQLPTEKMRTLIETLLPPL